MTSGATSKVCSIEVPASLDRSERVRNVPNYYAGPSPVIHQCGVLAASAVQSKVERESTVLRTDVLTEAIATQLGASALIFGDKGTVLCDAYYPKHAVLSVDECDEVIAWRHFALRCRDLFVDGEDTSWYEIK